MRANVQRDIYEEFSSGFAYRQPIAVTVPSVPKPSTSTAPRRSSLLAIGIALTLLIGGIWALGRLFAQSDKLLPFGQQAKRTGQPSLAHIPFPFRASGSPPGGERRWRILYPELHRGEFARFLDHFRMAVGRRKVLRDGLTYHETLEEFTGTPRVRRVLVQSDNRLCVRWRIGAPGQAIQHAVELLRLQKLDPIGEVLLLLPIELETHIAELEAQRARELHVRDLSRIDQTVVRFEQSGTAWHVCVERID